MLGLATPILRYIYHDHLNHGRGWPKWCRFIIKDWSWEDKRLAHDEYGDVFLCVSPEGLICYSADATMGWDVMNRRNDFTKPPDKYSELLSPEYTTFQELQHKFFFKLFRTLEPYGPNVATAEGATYRFHVRNTAPSFGDMSGANELVWNETIYQTRQLSQAWSQHETPQPLQMDVNSLTLSVISLAGFEALHGTTHYLVAILILPGWLLNLTPLRKAHVAHMQLDKYLREMIRVGKGKIQDNADHQSSDAQGNLLNAVMRASHSEERTNMPKTPGAQCRKQAFTEDEVMGNLFIYLLAGYETTANAIIYGLITLALHPEIQDKVIAEIDAVYTSAASDGRTELSYTQDFEKLQYTYGFMVGSSPIPPTPPSYSFRRSSNENPAA
ncbi:hypothetical protein MMC31_005960 [Peltigera leucophlebia]|nr:hypothetical protein [Peltigera leucophlebia]